MLVIELSLIGVAVGFMSGFFGIGGGAVLIPSLILLGFTMKIAIGISVMQMMFSSIYGSFLNKKKGTFALKEGIVLGLGGFLGAQGSGLLVSLLSAQTLKVIFIGSICLAIYRVFASAKNCESPRTASNFILFILGFCVGLVAISIGIGGGIFIVPFLIGFLHYDIRRAVALGLFFVVFSSVSGFVSHSFFGHIDYMSGLIIGLSSLLGVFFGVKYAGTIDKNMHKKLLLGVYISILVIMINRLFF